MERERGEGREGEMMLREERVEEDGRARVRVNEEERGLESVEWRRVECGEGMGTECVEGMGVECGEEMEVDYREEMGVECEEGKGVECEEGSEVVSGEICVVSALLEVVKVWGSALEA